MRKAKILIVDDEEDIRKTLRGSLEDAGLEVVTAGDGKEALAIVKTMPLDFVFLDIWLPGMDGMEILRAIKEFDNSLKVVIITGHGTVATAIQATKLGASDFLEKPLSLDSVFSTINEIIGKTSAAENNETKREKENGDIGEFIGESSKTIELRKKVNRLSRIDDEILIVGEKGTGKKMAAILIHQNSSRKNTPLVKIDCSLFLPEELEEALWGGSGKDVSSAESFPQNGALRKASQGTILLESIEEMALKTQEKLFQFIQDKEKNNLRLIATTMKNLREAFKEGIFSKNLYLHLKKNIVIMPTLRERKGDIPLLLNFFLKNFSAKHGRPLKEIDDNALKTLINFNWPGNVKELKNISERLVLSLPASIITVDDISPSIRGETIVRKNRIYDNCLSLKEAENAWKRNFILYNLKKNNWNIADTARKLKINRRNLHGYIKKLEIEVIETGYKKKSHQRTLKQSVVLSGRGLHSGLKTGLILSPLPPNSGIIFGNISTGKTIPAHIDYVESTEYATSLEKDGAVAGTIEHLMAVFHAYHISNLLIKINDEVPIIDGSAIEFCRLIEDAGIEEQDIPEEDIIIKEKYQIGKTSSESSFISIEPAEKFSVKYTLCYPKPVGKQQYFFVLENENSFKSEIAPARTFGFLKDIESLEKKGLASGGRLNNFILIDDEKIVNTELRFPDEFVRHKILDLMGDFYLLGRPIKGLVTAKMTGHFHNNALMKLIREKMVL